jgi:hypothetical protein
VTVAYTVDLQAQLTEVAQTVASRYADAHCAFLSGSLVEGIGNATSDVDVFVMHTRGQTVPSSATGLDVRIDKALVNIDYTDRFRVDTEHWQVADALAVARTIGDCDPTDDVAAGGIPEHQLQLAHRIRVGMPVLREAEFAELQAAFDWSRLSRVLALRFLSGYSDSAEDGAGAVRAGDTGTAMLASRQALGAAVDALLAAHGSTNNKQKWRFAKLRQLGDADLLARYLAAELEPSSDEAQILQTAKSRLRTAAALAQTVSTLLSAARSSP